MLQRIVSTSVFYVKKKVNCRDRNSTTNRDGLSVFIYILGVAKTEGAKIELNAPIEIGGKF